MDVATRLQPRQRAGAYLDRDRKTNANGNGNDVPEDSGNESESLIRRKFPRTAAHADSTSNIFRKPALPASATRAQGEQKSSITHRRRSTLRENVRVPSGPRDYPASPGKRVLSGSTSSIASIAPSGNESANSSRSFLPQSTSESMIGKGIDANRFSYGKPSPGVKNDPPSKPAERLNNDFDFIPSVSFDDLQNSIANYDGNGPLLSDFPAVGATRTLPRQISHTNLAKNSGSSGSATGQAITTANAHEIENSEDTTLSSSQSFRRRLSVVTGTKKSENASSNRDTSSGHLQPSGLSLRARRQSTNPQAPPPSGPVPPTAGAGLRAPRKSLGPGVISSMMEGRKASETLPNSATDPNLKSSLTRTNSLSRAARRITMQTSASGGAELPRAWTATTQSRANKVKSLQPPPREFREQDPNTPPVRSTSKANPARAHTPSSSGNRRQSTISGRASGLGARTISPTDARRLKRLSMMQAPPLPSQTVSTQTSKEPAPPVSEDLTSRPELPRLAQPSPSLIPRRATPTSARGSPEGRFGHNGGVSLSTRSSYASLNGANGTQSRLPTPKPRGAHSSNAQYGDEDEDVVPPVPAIPKAYESPNETDKVFFSDATKLSQPGNLSTETSISDFEASRSLRSATDTNFSRRKQSVESTRAHQRLNTMDNIERSINFTSAPRATRAHPDGTGRRNGNLQPLRLPPLNLMPLTAATSRDSNDLPRHSLDHTRQSFSGSQTPERRRVAKTPSTPMTASKAIFHHRQDEDFAKQKAERSSTSHFALRDFMQGDDTTTNFFDDTDTEFTGSGVPISASKPRNAITPFSSGSLPKGSGGYLKGHRSGPSGAFNFPEDLPLGKFQDYQLHDSEALQQPLGPRPSRSGTDASFKTAETRSSIESPMTEGVSAENERENGGGLRRKLSLGWKRTSSKTHTQGEAKSSPRQESAHLDKEKTTSKLQKRQGEMPPPRLPASATWTGDFPSIPSATSRPSFDSIRRKSTTTLSTNTSIAAAGPTDGDHSSPATKKSSLHNEQPQPVNTASRTASWNNVKTTKPSAAFTTQTRKTIVTPSIDVNFKDKDDAAADEEMRKLSQKRRDVDSAARESEELKKRAVARSPMTPERVLHDRNYALNIFERGEIMDFEKEGIYFTGTKTARKIVGNISSPQALGDKEKSGNYGYDDERGDYNIVLGDHLAYRYEVIDVLGKGSFGQVVRCVDHKEGGVVAVKIIRNKKRFHQQALVEVGILGRLREWDPDGAHATLSITSSFYFRSHLCIVTPCLSINLYELIRAHNFHGFSLSLIRRFARQLLACLVLLQHKKIIHCDLKPENILLCEARKADVRVIDFGSSCKEEEKVYTYIQSRFYRSPEVILGSTYGLGIDMWSLGCILAELLTGYPLFPGENEQEQLACIMEIFGPPDRHLVERCTRKKLFFDSVGKPRVTVSSKGRRRRPSSKTLAQALKSEDEAFLDFISRCLRWDPDRRLKPQEAINHPFITNQPISQRPGIPEEARRAARVRSTAAVPATNGSNVPSSIKRVPTTTGALGTASTNAFVQQQATPAKEKARPLPETPQTALRNAAPANAAGQGSPSKQSIGVARRTSTMATASSNGVPVVGSKRGSNGVPVVGASASVTPNASAAAQRLGSSNASHAGNLAQMAAREANAARWRA